MSSCSFRHAIGARGQLSYGDEECWGRGVEPTQRLAFKTEEFKNEIGDLRSEALDPNRATVRRIRGVSNISGGFAFEQNTQGYENLARHALGDSVTLQGVDGGINTRVTSASAASDVAITVADTSDFVGGGNYRIAAVYKDSSGKLQAEISATTLTVTDGVTLTGGAAMFTVALPIGAAILQANPTDWSAIYTHYIEAARDLPEGMTFEVGRDVAFFVYTGMKVNTLEYTYNAQEICQGTTALLGKAEYSGGDLVTATTEASTSIVIDNFGMDEYVAGQQVSAAILDDGGAFSDETAAANDDTAGDVTMFSISAQAGDYFYFGHGSKFSAIEAMNLVPQANAPAGLDWEYYDGTAWQTLLMTKDDIGDNLAATAAGDRVSTWDIPADMATNTINAQGPFYYVRCTPSANATNGTAIVADRIWHGPAAVGFPRNGGELQVGSENGISFSSYTIDYDLGTATLVVAASEWNQGSAHEIDEPVVSQQTWGHDVDPIPDSNPLSSFQAAAYMDGVFQEILSASVSLNNNLYADKFQLGDKFRAGIPEGIRVVECSLNAEFDDLILYRKFTAGRAFELEIIAVQDDEAIGGTGASADKVYASKTVFLPHVELTGTTPNIGGPDQILIDHPGVCLRDETRDINEMVVIFVNETAQI